MLKIYNKLHTAVGHLSDYKDLKVESTVADGDKTLSFTLLDKDFDIQCEYYIRTETDEYIVKEIDSDSDGNFTVVAALNLEELEQEQFQTFVLSTEVTIATAASTAIQWTGYTVATSDVTKLRKAGMVMCNARQVITNLCIAFMCEPVYDTINKTISFYQYRGSDRGAYLMSGLNLKKLSKKQSTYDFFTRIIPIGANGLTIEEVNSGRNYLENFQYASKILTYIWKDENYTDATALKEDAELYLNDLSKPEVSYSVDLLDLAKQSSGQYDVLAFGLGDNVTLIDSTTGTREKQRIKKLTEYPEEWWRNTAEIGNTTLTFEEMQSKYNDAMNIVNFALDSTGNYTGTINVSDVLHFDDGVAASQSIAEINQKFVAIDGKNYIFYQTTVPPTTGRKLNDAWFDTSAGGKMHYWNGAAWQENQFGTDAIEDHAIIADKILVNTALANEIFAQNITASGTITGGKFKGASSNSYIESATYAYTSGNYSDSGIHIDLSSQGYIRAKNFAVDASGNAYFKGAITGSSFKGASSNSYIESATYSYSSGNYSASGVRIDLTGQGYIRAKNFAVDASGNAYFNGTIESSSGMIGIWSITSGSINNRDPSLAMPYSGLGAVRGTNGYAFFANETNRKYGDSGSNASFYVTNAGLLHCNDTNSSDKYVELNGGTVLVRNVASSVIISTDIGVTRAAALTTTENIVISRIYRGLYLTASNGQYPAIYDNGSNLWIGAASTAGAHHIGGTYISAGHTGSAGNPTVYVCVPNAANNGGTNYAVLHAGNYGGYATFTTNLSTTGSITASGAINGASVSATGNITASGTMTASAFSTSGTISSASLSTTGNISASGSVSGASLSTTGNITASGTVTATNLDGNVKNYNGNFRKPVTTVTDDGRMVSALQMRSPTLAQINGQNGTAGSGTDWFNISISQSDRRLKENIKDSALDALALVDQLRLRSFDWKNDKSHWDVGFVADEVYDIDQHLAIKPDDEESEYWSINDFYLLGVLTKAVQEMSAKIKELERRISA